MGHRPCHSAALETGPAGGQSPRPAPDPPLAGASRPPGRALASRCSRTCRSTGHRPTKAGETQCVSCPRPQAGRKVLRCSTYPAAMAKAIAFATSSRCPLPTGGQSPRPAPAASPTGPPAGAGLCCACMTGPCRTVVLDRAGKRCLSTPARGASPYPTDQGDFPVRQAAGMPFSTRQRQGHSPVPALWTGGCPAARFVPAGPLI
jgi:hypothetical protein